MKRLKTLSILMMLGVILTTTITQTVNAAIDTDFFSSNDIIFYDPTCSGAGDIAIVTGTPSKSLDDFVDKYGQAAFNIGKKYGIPYEAILAQAALESGMGNSQLTLQANNFFGIKAGGNWTGPTITMPTAEQTPGGGTYIVNAQFRKYATPEEGFDGYGQFITQNSRYNQALKFPGDYLGYIKAIKDAGYATDVNYVSKVGGLADSIAKYIAKTGKWPPSSQVAKDSSPGSTGSSSSASGNAPCTSTSGNGSNEAIRTAALGYAWPNKGRHNGTAQSLATLAYQSPTTGMPHFNDYSHAGSTPWTDCGVFVATVMHASGADPKYVGRITGSQLDYVKSSSKYTTFVPGPKGDTTMLHPGDVFIINQGSNGHTYVYTGSYQGDDGKTYTMAQASLGDHPPEAGNVFFSDERGNFTVARVQ